MRLRILFHEVSNCLVPSVRLVFSVFHPEMTAAGIEANFERSAVEYRLGAERHTVGGRLKPNSIEARFTVMLQPGDNGSGFMPKPR